MEVLCDTPIALIESFCGEPKSGSDHRVNADDYCIRAEFHFGPNLVPHLLISDTKGTLYINSKLGKVPPIGFVRMGLETRWLFVSLVPSPGNPCMS
jgi:hypothetical protein